MKPLKNFFFIALLFFSYLITLVSCGNIFVSEKKLSQDTTLSMEIREWSKRIEKYPKNIEYRLSRVQAFVDESLFELAIEDMEKIIKMEPERSEYHSKLGDIYFADNQTVNSLESYQKAVEVNPFDQGALFKLAQFHYFVRQFDKSEVIFHKLLKENPNHIETHFHLGLLYKEKEDTLTAIDYLKKTIDLAGTHYNSTIQIAQLYDLLGDPEGETYYNMALSIDEESEEAHFGLAYLYQRRGEYDKAKKHYLKATELFPKYVSAYYNLGNIFAIEGDYKNAITQFKFAINFAPEYPKPFNRIAQCYELMGDKEKAILYYEQCLEVDPDFEMALNGLERLNKELEIK